MNKQQVTAEAVLIGDLVRGHGTVTDKRWRAGGVYLWFGYSGSQPYHFAKTEALWVSR